MSDTGTKTGMIESLVRRVPPDFGRTRPEIHYWLFAPVLLAQLGWAASTGAVSLPSGILLFALGAFAWTLLEYFLHRFSFHSKLEHPLVRPFNSGLHMLHHRDPASRLYVGAPIVLAAPVYALTLLAFRLVTGTGTRAIVMGSGLILGFLFYEFAHYTAHQRNPKTRLMKYLKKHHMLHHFADDANLFGVTTPFWDLVFGTLKHPEQRRARAVSQRAS